MIQKYMTTTPNSIGAEQTLHTALDLMAKHAVRHLPVLKAGTLVGILSDRDLKMAMSLRGIDVDRTTVEEVATEEVYITEPNAPVNEVVAHMAEHRLGSALVVQNHKLVGIFTSTDAMRVLGEIFETRLH